MKEQTIKKEASRKEQNSLRNRIRRFYRHFNKKDWEYCFDCVDPRLREQNRVEFSTYAESIGSFRAHYGDVDIWHIDIQLFLDVKNNKRDDRDFAYVYIFWQDKNYDFHVFRERWVKDSADWFTRVVGLVVHENAGTTD